jgi:hypothetical protein
MSSYEQRLDNFAGGRRFARMSRPVRNRADAWCDACGSIQARVLFGIKDEQTGSVYFVGERCLQQIAERGGIVRRFCKEPADAAYASRYQASVATQGSGTATAALATEQESAALAVSTELLTAVLVLALPSANAGLPPHCISLPLDDEAAVQTITLLQHLPALRERLRTLGLNPTSGPLERNASDTPSTNPSAAIAKAGVTRSRVSHRAASLQSSPPERPGHGRNT